MKKIESKQRDVPFVFCNSPITIDKSASWGTSGDSFQVAPNGAFLKMSSATVVSHLVQPNADKTAPLGWVPGSGAGLFDKAPIWIEEEIRQAGTTINVRSADNAAGMPYTVNEPSVVCYNDVDGKPNMEDGWVQTLVNIQKNYEY